MSRKQKRKPDRLAIEARRRAKDAARVALVGSVDTLAPRVARIMAELAARHLDNIRRELAGAAQRARAQRLLEAALAPEHDYGWKPWGYIIEEQAAPVRPMVPQLRLVHSRHTVELPVITLGRRLAVAA